MCDPRGSACGPSSSGLYCFASASCAAPKENMLNKWSLRSRVRKFQQNKSLAAAAVPSLDEQQPQHQQQQQQQQDEEAEEEDVWSVESFAESLFPVIDTQTPTSKSRSTLSFSSVSVSSAESTKSVAATAATSPSDDEAAADVELPEYDQAEEEFLERYEDYFEHLALDNVRKDYYSVLELQKIVHLDYVASPLASTHQVQEQGLCLLDEACRPMSSLASTALAKKRALETKERLLCLFNTDDEHYSISFTTNLSTAFTDATSSSCCSNNKQHRLLVCQDANPAAIRRSARRMELIPVHHELLYIPGRDMRKAILSRGGGLFVLPAQSALSGAAYSLNWVAEAQQNGWQVLLDATHYLPGKLDLALYQPDFVVGSLHHLVGAGQAPSIQAFLLVRNKNHRQLEMIQPNECSMRSAAMDFAALNCGLEHLANVVGLERVSSRVNCLSSWLYGKLKNIRHQQHPDRPLLKMYGPPPAAGSQGHWSTLVFNLLDSTGNPFPSGIVQRMAETSNIILGSIQAKPLLPPSQHLSALRISLGPVSNFQDVYRFLCFVLRFRDEDYMSLQAMSYIEDKDNV